MAPGEQEELSDRRAARARELAVRYPASREVLLFYAEIAEFRGDFEQLCTLVNRCGPVALREAAKTVDIAQAIARYQSGEDRTSPPSFFARVLLRPRAGTVNEGTAPFLCPHCGCSPQVGCLRAEGDGTALSLVCSLCSTEWRFPRGTCPACGESAEEKIAYYSAEGFEHVQVAACEACRRYLHVVNLAKDPRAVPEVDEIAALPLDVWAREQGWEKVHPNLVGM